MAGVAGQSIHWSVIHRAFVILNMYSCAAAVSSQRKQTQQHARLTMASLGGSDLEPPANSDGSDERTVAAG